MSKKNKQSKSDLKKLWGGAFQSKDEVSGFEPDEGKYPVRYTSAALEQSESSGRWQIHYVQLFLNGDYKGKKLHSFDGVDNEQSQRYAIKRLEALGYEVEDFDKLEDVLKKIVKKKPAAMIKVKHSGEFINTFALNVLTDEELEELEADGGDGDGKEEKEEKEEKNDKAEFATGDKVKFEDDGDEVEGIIKSIDGDDVVVKDEDGKKYEVDVDDLEKIEDDEDEEKDKGDKSKVEKEGDDDDEPKFKKGDKVKWEDDGDDMEGVVRSVDDDEAVVKDEDGKKHTVELDDLEKVEDEDEDEEKGGKKKEDKEEEEVSIEVGMKVECFKKGKSLGTGKVRKVNEAEGTVTVKINGEKQDFKVDDLKLPD